ncbi:hypothetical protein [Paracoccus sp. MC1862]|uniref:hypothetical protein n=1 Tax=Paracoccus sp. MC1862 TaxID=2760307 RepID=UPI001602F9D2|nr:hypothetical protein [Paracoccus sp. MC1862]MBB1496842.1 hypothetical protein [Paracoccus sp. MC1862]QQO45469.1 hypothetical protein JGR78_03705 [Paracoccus sp. MC1862]
MAAPHAIHGDFPADADRIDPSKMTGSGFAWLPDDAETGSCKPRAMLRDEAACLVAGG